MPSRAHFKTEQVALVAGGAGFLGSHLVRRLLDQGLRVTALDNLQTGCEQNLSPFRGNPRFQFVKSDITGPVDVGPADYVFNLACPASPVHYQADPIRTLKTSVIGTLNLLEFAERNTAVFMQASTSEVYGDPLEHPQAETYWGHVNPTGIRACYDEGKRAAETLCFDFQRMRGLDVRVARIFNTYGPNMDPRDGRVVSNFIMQALQHQDVTIYGDGTQTRSFCYVDDLVEGFLALVLARPAPEGPVNLGNPVEFTVRELADKVVSMTGSTSAIQHLPLPQDDPRQRRPDISKARRLLSWEPKVDLLTGLESTIAYFREHVSAIQKGRTG
jgi:UDP-glucuronate decarboxylase